MYALILSMPAWLFLTQMLPVRWGRANLAPNPPTVFGNTILYVSCTCNDDLIYLSYNCWPRLDGTPSYPLSFCIPPGALRSEQLLPDCSPAERRETLESVRRFLKSLPFGRRPLVKASVKMASDEAVRQLQMQLSPLPNQRSPAPLELENVHPRLLLPPHEQGGVQSALTGGRFDLGDRVACVRSIGTPPFGLRGTVIGEQTAPGLWHACLCDDMHVFVFMVMQQAAGSLIACPLTNSYSVCTP